MPGPRAPAGPDRPPRDQGVQATFHYVPLHYAPAGERYGRAAGDGCPVTDDVSARLVRLPLFAGMADAELDRVVAAVRSYPFGS